MHYFYVAFCMAAIALALSTHPRAPMHRATLCLIICAHHEKEVFYIAAVVIVVGSIPTLFIAWKVNVSVY
jgi:hypothetical protein